MDPSELRLTPSPSPITGPVTKFGGQPFWLEEPAWPVAATGGEPMQFVGQIRLEGPVPALAYIFIAHDDDGMAETWEPAGGDNAVIVQPGAPSPWPSIANATGPSLYTMVKKTPHAQRLEPEPVEFAAAAAPCDPSAEVPPAIKRGGTPDFLQHEEYPTNAPDRWRLLVQIDSTQVPFWINFGGSGIGYVFISSDSATGAMLWQS